MCKSYVEWYYGDIPEYNKRSEFRIYIRLSQLVDRWVVVVIHHIFKCFSVDAEKSIGDDYYLGDMLMDGTVLLKKFEFLVRFCKEYGKWN